MFSPTLAVRAMARASASSVPGSSGPASSVPGPSVPESSVPGSSLQSLEDLAVAAAAHPEERPAGPKNSKAKAKAKCARAARNAKGTFAGRRPPNNPQLAVFLNKKELHHETRSARVPGDRKRKGKGATDTQGNYWGFMQQRMAELATEGVQGGERMKLAAKAWKERTGNEGKTKATLKGSAETPKPAVPVRLDTLTPAQEMMLENGKPHVYVEASEQ